jgi:MFS family permease
MNSIWKVRYHFIVLILFLLVKFIVRPDTALPDSHPYKLKFIGIHVINNLMIYMKYIITEIVPSSLYLGRKYLELGLYREIIALGVIVSILAIIFYFIKKKKTVINLDWNIIFFCLLFLFIGLGPVIFLPNHQNRYYLTLPSMSFIILFVYFFQKILELFKITKRKRSFFLTAYLILHFILASADFNFIFSKNGYYARQIEVSEKAHTFMKQNYPTLAENSIVVIKGIDIFALNRSSALRVWYQDKTLEAYDFKNLIYEGGKYFIKNPVLTQEAAFTGKKAELKVELIPGKTVILEFKNGHYIDITESLLSKNV